MQAVYDHTGHMCETEFETRKEEAKKKEFFKELIPELIADIKVNIDTMNEKIAQNDCETIAALAHKIKGTFIILRTDGCFLYCCFCGNPGQRTKYRGP